MEKYVSSRAAQVSQLGSNMRTQLQKVVRSQQSNDKKLKAGRSVMVRKSASLSPSRGRAGGIPSAAPAVETSLPSQTSVDLAVRDQKLDAFIDAYHQDAERSKKSLELLSAALLTNSNMIHLSAQISARGSDSPPPSKASEAIR
jgi:hypothetical protein